MLAHEITISLSALLDDIGSNFLHVQRLELAKRPRHVEQREGRLAIHGHLEAALAGLLLVDHNFGARKASLDERLQLGGPRLECASGLAGLDLDQGLAAGRLLGGRRLLPGSGLLCDRLRRRHYSYISAVFQTVPGCGAHGPEIADARFRVFSIPPRADGRTPLIDTFLFVAISGAGFPYPG